MKSDYDLKSWWTSDSLTMNRGRWNSRQLRKVREAKRNLINEDS